MTAFITRAWKNGRTAGAEALARRGSAASTDYAALAPWLKALALTLALWGALFMASAPARAAEISALSAERTAEGVVVSAQVRIDLPPLLDDALQKGIPLFFVAEAVVQRDRWYWTDKEVARASRYLRLSYHPLTRRWRLLVSNSPFGNSGTALAQTFESREEALAAVERIAGWKIAEPAEVDGAPRFTLTLRFRLDLAQLPRPLQIGALGQDDAGLDASRSLRLNPEPAR